MTSFERFSRLSANGWYVQKTGGYPLYLHTTAWSGMAPMRSAIGFRYTRFLFRYENGQCEMWYWTPDFPKIWKQVKQRLQKNPGFLRALRVRVQQNFDARHNALARREKTLRSLDNAKLVSLFKDAAALQTDSVGASHILEACGNQLEAECKTRLAEFITDPSRFWSAFSALTTPRAPSFLAREESDLHRIARKPASAREEDLRAHAKKYSWIQNSYRGSRHPTVAFFRRRMNALVRAPLSKTTGKKKYPAELPRDRTLNRILRLIDFCAAWQDDRKMNIMKANGLLGDAAREIARRARIPMETVTLLSISDVQRLKTLKDFKKWKPLLAKRKKGALFLMEGEGEWIATGKQYARLMKKFSVPIVKTRELKGTPAHAGLARGRVAVCLTPVSLYKIKKGDILVTSMTRPDFMMAFRKISAIVTDEGGITSHAAIVSRELEIPCIVGTKVATQVFRDGDTVEVDTEKGIVRKV